MKKIFTLAAAFALVGNAMADDIVTKLDHTLVMYTTQDTITSGIGIIEDEDTGEEIEAVVPVYWTGADMVNAFNACGLPLTGTSTTQTQYKVTTRNSYKDAQTGFEMPAGSYRGVFVDGTISLTGSLGDNTVQGFSNCKSMVLYFVPIPTTWIPAMGISHQDYPTGRVQAKYVGLNDEGSYVATSNQGYREIHINEKADNVNDPEVAVVKSTDALNFARTNENPLDITIDQPFKLEVNLQNLLNGTDYEGIFENAETKQSEFANLVIEADQTEAEMSYYFADPSTCDPYYDSTAPYTYASASGYDCLGHKWGTKVEWSNETVIQLAVKKRMYLVGMAIVSATEGAPSKFMNASEKLGATWKDTAIAYGHYGDQSIEAVSNDSQTSSRIYNLQGQQMQAAKGLCIKDGKIICIK